jgi:hypothetical protein
MRGCWQGRYRRETSSSPKIVCETEPSVTASPVISSLETAGAAVCRRSLLIKSLLLVDELSCPETRRTALGRLCQFDPACADGRNRRNFAVRTCSGEGRVSTLSRPPGAGTKARRAPFPLSAPPPLDPGHHPVNLAAAAPGTAQPLAPIDNRRFGTYRAAISAGTGST